MNAVTGRERLLALVAVLVVGLLAVDRYVLAPFWEQGRLLEERRRELLKDKHNARLLLARRAELERVWKGRLDASLVAGPSLAERQVLHALRDWSQDSGLSLSSVRPEGAPTGDGDLRELGFQTVGTGSMRAVARFLWRVEQCGIPLHVTQVQLSARRDGEDDLSLQLRLSTLFRATAPTEGEPEPEPAPPRQEWDRYEVLHERNLFLRDRRPPAPDRPTESAPQDERPASAPDPDRYLRLIGIYSVDGDAAAVFEDSLTGSVRRVRSGQDLGRGRVDGIDLKALHYRVDGLAREVRPGQSLAGGASARASARPVSTPGPMPAETGDANSILERLRQRRQREVGR